MGHPRLKKNIVYYNYKFRGSGRRHISLSGQVLSQSEPENDAGRSCGVAGGDDGGGKSPGLYPSQC